MAYYLALTTHTQVVSAYGMILCQLGHNSEKVSHNLDLKIAF